VDDFASRLKELRAREKLSQYELAAKLNLSRQAIYQWESRTRTPNAGAIIALANFFNVTTDFLLGRTEY